MSEAVEVGSPADTEHLDILDPNGIEARLRIRVRTLDPVGGTSVMSVHVPEFSPIEHARPVLCTFAVLTDVVGGLVNHLSRPADAWTVTSELSMDIAGAVIAGDEVVGSSELLSVDDSGALSVTRFVVDDRPVGVATVRSFYIPATPVADEDQSRHPQHAPVAAGIEELLAVRPAAGDTDGEVALVAEPDPVVENAIGCVHGGVVAAALCCAGFAALEDSGASGMSVGSARVNYFRPFIAGDGAAYRGRADRIGRHVASAVANAVAPGGKIAATARVTAYS